MIKYIYSWINYFRTKRKKKKSELKNFRFATCSVTLPAVYLDSCDIKEIQKQSLDKYNKIQESK